MYWEDTCQTAADVREHRRQVQIKRIASRIPKALPPPPEPPPQLPATFDLIDQFHFPFIELLENMPKPRAPDDWLFFDRSTRVVKIGNIFAAVCRAWNVSLDDLTSDRRTHDVIPARHVALLLAKMLTARSLPDIGRRMGGRDHTTVLHACKKFAWLAEQLKIDLPPDAPIADFVARARELLRP